MPPGGSRRVGPPLYCGRHQQSQQHSHSIDMQVSSALLTSLLLVASATATNKISCYVCNSESNAACGDPIMMGDGGVKPQACSNEITSTALGVFNSVSKGVSNLFGVEKTPQADFACLKMSFTVKNGDAEKKIVQRTCSLQGLNFCETAKEKQKDSADFFCQECTTDECNGSGALRAAVFVLVPAVALFLATY